MTTEVWLAFISAVLLLMSTPGASQLLMLSNSMENGFRRSLATASGDLSANLLQMLVASLGLGAVISASEAGFVAVRLLGAVYLCWMGLDRIRSRRSSVRRPSRRRSLSSLWWQGFITSASNPKAVAFFAALFPQFIRPEGAFWGQFLILAGTYVVLDGAFLLAYGGGAEWIGRHLRESSLQWIDRTSGALLVATSILLALSSVRR